MAISPVYQVSIWRVTSYLVRCKKYLVLDCSCFAFYTLPLPLLVVPSSLVLSYVCKGLTLAQVFV